MFQRELVGHFEIYAFITLTSNLRPTTRECVHLVTRGHFLSRYKDGIHTRALHGLKIHGPAWPVFSLKFSGPVRPGPLGMRPRPACFVPEMLNRQSVSYYL